jgi:hypothetical protein
VNPELAQKMTEKSDQELLDMFEAPDDWRPESLEAARAELRKRNIAEPVKGGGAQLRDSERIEGGPKPPRLVAKKCSWCGRENAGEAENCSQCGTKLDEDSPAEENDVNGPGNVPPLLDSKPPVREGIMCAQHTKVQAVQQCRRCGGFMCATCDFAFPGDIHFCPTCVSRGDEGLSGKRKKFMIWSFVLAAWSTVGMTCLLSGAMRGMARTKEDQTVLGWVLIIFVLGPTLTGLSLGLSAKRKKTSNPAALWIAIIWNAVLVASYVLLTLIGLSRR